MPFTPVHMGPGILLKAVLQGSFSLMVFGWTQIVMDIQPLLVMLIGEGHLHGFTHTFVGASLIAVVAALSGKYLSELGLRLLRITEYQSINIKWSVAYLSAFIGSFSHVILDGIMHNDLAPFSPLFSTNHFLGTVTISELHQLCLYSGLIGAALFFCIQWRRKLSNKL